MRKLAQALLITLGCFSAAGIYAQEEGSESDVVIDSEGGQETPPSRNFLLCQQQDETADETGKN